jgi:hypothetical protein
VIECGEFDNEIECESEIECEAAARSNRRGPGVWSRDAQVREGEGEGKG